MSGGTSNFNDGLPSHSRHFIRNANLMSMWRHYSGHVVRLAVQQGPEPLQR